MWHLPVHLVQLTLAVVAATNVDAGSASAEKRLPLRLQLLPPPSASPRDPNDPPMDYELHRVKGGSGDLTYEAPGFTALRRSCLLYTSPSPRDRQKSRMP